MELKKYQKANKKTISETAKDLNLPISTFNNYLRETREPDIKTLIKLADYYNTTIDNLVGRTTKNDLYISQEKKELHQMIEQLNERNYFQARIYVSGLLAGQI